MTPLQVLQRIDACSESKEWVGDFAGNGHLSRKLWRTCPRGDWLIWLATRLGVDRRYVVAALCACLQGAELCDEERAAVDAAIAWTQGTGTLAAFDDTVAKATRAYWAKHSGECEDMHSIAAGAIASARDEANAASDAVSFCRPRETPHIDRQQADRIRAVIPWRLVTGKIRELEATQ